MNKNTKLTRILRQLFNSCLYHTTIMGTADVSSISGSIALVKSKSLDFTKSVYFCLSKFSVECVDYA